MRARFRMLAGRAWGVLRHPISQNALALYWVQIATFVVPLVTLPYLSRVLEPEGFGLVVFAQSFSFILGLVVNFGFDGTATREAAAHRDEPGALGELVARVQGAKLLLVGLSALVALVALAFVSKMHEHPGFLLFAWIAAVGQGLGPGWLFIGLERVRLPAVIQLSSRIITAALTFVVVQGRGDGIWVLVLYAVGTMTGSVITNALMYRIVPALRPRLSASLAALRESWVLFVGLTGVTLYTSANVVVLGLFVANAQVAHFGAAERIVRAAVSALGPVAVAVYPRLAFLHASDEPERARRLAWITIAVLGGVGLVAAVVLALLAPVIIPVVYGPGFREAVDVLRVLAFIIPPISVGGALAAGWMLALRMDRKITKVILRAGVLNILLGCLAAPLFGPLGMAACVLVAELVVLGGCLYEIRRQEAGTEGVRLLRRPVPRRA